MFRPKSDAARYKESLKIGRQIIAVNSVNVQTATVKEVRALFSANSSILIEVKVNKKLVGAYRKARQLKAETLKCTLVVISARLWMLAISATRLSAHIAAAPLPRRRRRSFQSYRTPTPACVPGCRGLLNAHGHCIHDRYQLLELWPGSILLNLRLQVRTLQVFQILCNFLDAATHVVALPITY